MSRVTTGDGGNTERLSAVACERHGRERGAFFEALATAIPEPWALLDLAGNILACNPAFADRLGATPDLIEGRSLQGAGLSKDAERRLLGQILKVTATGVVATVPDLRDGFALRLMPVRDDAGHVRSIGATAASPETICSCSGEDACRVAGRLLSMANHELRQPLQAIQIFHHLLASRLTDPGMVELGDNLGKAIADSEQTLCTVIDLVRLEAGLIRPQLEVVDLDKVLLRVVGERAATARGRRIRLRLPARHKGAAVRSDARLLAQLLAALLDHALAVASRGGVLVGTRRPAAVALGVRPTSAGASVEPTPVPIDQAAFSPESPRGKDSGESAALGEPVLRLEVWNTARRVGATGRRELIEGLGPVGLAVRLARLLGHELRFDDRPGRGSVARLHLPLVPLQRAEPSRELLPADG